MDQKKVVEMKPVSLFEVKEILKARKAEKELNYEQDLTMKYVERFSQLTEKQTTDLLKALKEINFLKDKDELIYQIAAALPTKEEQVKLFLTKDITATDEEIKQVIELTKKFEDKI